MSKFIGFESVSFGVASNFSMNKQNRACNPRHLDTMKKQMLHSLDIMPAITVNIRTNHIIDGQHRHKAFMYLMQNELLPANSTIKVMWVDIPYDEEIDAIISANTNSKNWTLDNYISSYIEAGLVSYVKLDEWCKTHTLACENGKTKIRYGAAIITGRRVSKELKTGSFTFTEDELKRAEVVHTEMCEILKMLDMKKRGMLIESLATSWINVRDQHDFATWMKEFKSKKAFFQRLPKDNSKDWDAIFAQAHLSIDTKSK